MASVYSKKTATGWQLRIDYSSEQSIKDNSSTLELALWIYSGTASSYNQNPNSAYYILAGRKTYKPYSYPSTGWHKLGTRTLSLKHEDDGNRRAHLTAEWCSGFDSAYTPYKIELDAYVDLPKIPRVSTLSFPRMRMGKASTITIKRANASFVDKLSYSFGDLSGTIADKTSAATVSWTPPTALATQIPKAPSGSGTLTVRTYQGSEYIGKRSYTFVADAPSDAVPSVSVTLSDGKGLTDKYHAYVQHQSTLHAVIQGTAKYGASIKSHNLQIGGVQYNGREITTAPVPDSGTVHVRYGVTDSRGKSSTDTTGITVLPWAPPSVSRLTVSRCDARGTADPEGAYGLVTFSGQISPLSNKNTAAWRVKYRPIGESQWTEVAARADGQYAPAGVSVVISADINKGYDVCIAAVDDFGSVDSIITTLSPAMAIFRLNVRRRALTWGEELMQDNTFRVGGIFKHAELPDDTTIGGRPVLSRAAVPITAGSGAGYKVAIEADGNQSIRIDLMGQVVLSLRLTLTVTSNLAAGGAIIVGSIATGGRPGKTCAANIYARSTNPRRYMAAVESGGDIVVRPSADMGPADYTLYISATYIV